jgi:hypothetical protein
MAEPTCGLDRPGARTERLGPCQQLLHFGAAFVAGSYRGFE